MEPNDPGRDPAPKPGDAPAEQSFARRISCAPPAEAPRETPTRPGAHGTGRPGTDRDAR